MPRLGKSAVSQCENTVDKSDPEPRYLRKEQSPSVRTLSKSFLVVAGLLSQAPAVDPAMLTPSHYDGDSRLVRLREFFLKHDSPVHYLASEFLEAADKNGLDWRLLPTIALVESGEDAPKPRTMSSGGIVAGKAFPASARASTRWPRGWPTPDYTEVKT